MAFVLFGVGAALLYLASRRCITSVAAGDDVHDDPACPHYGKTGE